MSIGYCKDVIPDLIEPIIGWRMWNTSRYANYTGVVGQITSCSYRYREVWLNDGKRAICGNFARHSAPHEYCTCGYYAASSLEALNRVDMVPEVYFVAQVVGTVELSGKVIQHEYGYRSEYQKMHRLFVYARERPTAASSAALLKETYKVPVFFGTQMPTMNTEYFTELLTDGEAEHIPNLTDYIKLSNWG